MTKRGWARVVATVVAAIVLVAPALYVSAPARAYPVPPFQAGEETSHFDAAITVGTGVVDFYNSSAGLMEATPAGAGYTTQVVDPDGGLFVSAVVMDGSPEVFYYRPPNLMAATQSASGWSSQVLDGPGSPYAETGASTSNDEGQGVSATLVDGSPYVFYTEGLTNHVRVGWLVGGVWHFRSVATAAISSAMPGAGQAAVSLEGQPNFFVLGGDSLYRIWLGGGTWQVSAIESVAMQSWNPTALVVGGMPHVFLQEGYYDLVHIWPSGGSWHQEPVDGLGTQGHSAFPGATYDRVGYTSTAAVVGGSINVWYEDTTGGSLRHAIRNSAGGWTSETLDGREDAHTGEINRTVGMAPAAAIDGAGVAQIFYQGSAPDVAERHYWVANGTAHYAFIGCDACQPVGSHASLSTVGQNDNASVLVNGEPQVFIGGNTLYDDYYDGRQWHSETLESGTPYSPHPEFVSLSAVNVNGLPYVFYFDEASGQLREQTWRDGAWHRSIVDGPGADASTPGVETSLPAGRFVSATVVDRSPVLFYLDFFENLRYAHVVDGHWSIEKLPYASASQPAAFSDADGPHVAFEYAGDLTLLSQAGNDWISHTIDGPDSTLPGHTAVPMGGGRPAGMRSGGALDLFYETSPGTNSGGGPPPFTPDPSNPSGVLRHAHFDGTSWSFEAVDGAGSATPGATLDSVGGSVGAVKTSAGFDLFYTRAGTGADGNVDHQTLRVAEQTGDDWTARDLDGYQATPRGAVEGVVGLGATAVVHDGAVDAFYGGGLTVREAAHFGSSAWTLRSLPPYVPGTSSVLYGDGEPDYEPEASGAFTDRSGVVHSLLVSEVASQNPVGSDRLGGRAIGAPAAVSITQAGAESLPIFFAVGVDHEVYERSGSLLWQRIAPNARCSGSPAATVRGSTIDLACRSTHNRLRYSVLRVGNSGLPVPIGRWHSIAKGLKGAPAVATVAGKLTFFIPVGRHHIDTVSKAGMLHRTRWNCIGHGSASTLGDIAAFACRLPNGGVHYAINRAHRWSAMRQVPFFLTPLTQEYKAVTAPAITLTLEGPQFFWQSPKHKLTWWAPRSERLLSDASVWGGTAAAAVD